MLTAAPASPALGSNPLSCSICTNGPAGGGGADDVGGGGVPVVVGAAVDELDDPAGAGLPESDWQPALGTTMTAATPHAKMTRVRMNIPLPGLILAQAVPGSAQFRDPRKVNPRGLDLVIWV